MSSLETRLRRQVVRGSRTTWHRFRAGPVGLPRATGVPGERAHRATPTSWASVQKAGTSWWNALLEAHPDVHRTKGQPKELHFFDGLWDKPWSAADATRYARYFPRPSGKLTGEWTPGYIDRLLDPRPDRPRRPPAPRPGALRDPVDRFRSGLTHTDDASLATLSHRDAAGGFQRGLYAQQLRRVFDAFPREQVLVLQYEACRETPRGSWRARSPPGPASGGSARRPRSRASSIPPPGRR